jgi:uncharacterized protein (DUF58 family)
VLTRTGLGVAVGAIVCAVVGVLWGYAEFIALAGTAAAALLLALIMSRRSGNLELRRRPVTPRVTRGERIQVRYHVMNRSRRRVAACRVFDSFQGAEGSIDVPTLRPHSTFDASLDFVAKRRGMSPLGPTSIELGDPLALASATVLLDLTDSVLVQPRIYPLLAMSGVLQVVSNDSAQRRLTADPQAGFQSLREYVHGDDPRLIHWPTTARTGELMVREFVEVRRPQYTVVLDTSAHVASPDDFEEMVDVAASVACRALGSGYSVVVRVTTRSRPGARSPLENREQVLDLLTPVHQDSGTALLPVASLFSSGLGSEFIVLVTGPRGPSSSLGSDGDQVVVRIGVGATTHGQHGGIAAPDASAFATRWGRNR